ncbi:uncharacterized protein LOC133896302 [Phragmites australis]|uniref:uncharacterized protein LOC133896302 n=1 Tax=Phragmites australis TaxID=29695 RepID=UPI002D77638A|nr:uncharacterized protein LOC133896302 [Phragmites australis]
METAASSSSMFSAHPCLLLQYIVRACAGYLLGLCGGSDGDGAQPSTASDTAATSQGELSEGGSKPTVRDLAGAQVLARRRKPPGRPGGPREGRGGSGGSHN